MKTRNGSDISILRFPWVLRGRQDLSSLGCAFGEKFGLGNFEQSVGIDRSAMALHEFICYSAVVLFDLLDYSNLISLVETLMMSQKRSMPTQAQSVRRVTAKSDKFAKKSSTRKYPTSASRDNQ